MPEGRRRGTGRIIRSRTLWRGIPALTALVSAAALAAGTGPASAVATGPAAVQAGRSSPAGTISTVAGGVGGPARAVGVALDGACGVSFGAGRLYVADSSAVRAVNPQTDWLTTPAGDGAGFLGPEGDGGPATAATLIDTCGTALDHAGNLVLADGFHDRIRVVAAASGTFYAQAMTAGDIYAVAGIGKPGSKGDGGPALDAELSNPSAVAVDAAGNLVIADSGSNRIRVVAESSGTFYGKAMTAGDIYTVAGGGRHGLGDGGPAIHAALSDPAGVAVDGSGNLLIADLHDERIRVVAESTGTFYGVAMTAGDIYTVAGDGKRGFSGDGGPATSAEVSNPPAVTADGAGNLVIADAGNHRVRVVAGSTGTFYGVAMTAGDIYTVAGDGTAGTSGDGGPALSAELAAPGGVAVDGSGNLVIADPGSIRVRVVAAATGTFYGQGMTAGDIYTVAGEGRNGPHGDGRPATTAQFEADSLNVDGAGDILIADPEGRVWLVAGRTGTLFGRAMTAGDIYQVAGIGHESYSGDGGPAIEAGLNTPLGVTADAAGNLVITDSENFRIRVVAAKTGTFYGRAMTLGDIYTVAGDGTAGFSGDGGPATSAELNVPFGVTLDAAGNIVFADSSNNRIRVVAESTGEFYGQSMTAGDIYTVAGDSTAGFSGDGGPATSAELNNPSSVRLDGAGNLVIADTGNNRIRVVAESTGEFYGQSMTAGDIYTVAGDGTGGYAGDGGPATSARLNAPPGAAVDAAGNLLIADNENQRVRVVAESTGEFYGVAMTAGDIYTVAGDGTEGFSGDGGPATSAELAQPFDVAVDSAGNLLFADAINGRIRMVAG